MQNTARKEGLIGLGIAVLMLILTLAMHTVWTAVLAMVVQTGVWLLGGISGWFFIIDEILLFVVLVFVKHRVPSPWQDSAS